MIYSLLFFFFFFLNFFLKPFSYLVFSSLVTPPTAPSSLKSSPPKCSRRTLGFLSFFHSPTHPSIAFISIHSSLYPHSSPIHPSTLTHHPSISILTHHPSIPPLSPTHHPSILPSSLITHPSLHPHPSSIHPSILNHHPSIPPPSPIIHHTTPRQVHGDSALVGGWQVERAHEPSHRQGHHHQVPSPSLMDERWGRGG